MKEITLSNIDKTAMKAFSMCPPFESFTTKVFFEVQWKPLKVITDNVIIWLI